jgi:Bacterial SH3 domain
VTDDERPEASDRLWRPSDDASTSEAGRPADQGDLWLGMSPAQGEPQADAVALVGNGDDTAAPVEEEAPAADPGAGADTGAAPEGEVAAEPAVEAYAPGIGEPAVDPDLADALANVGLEGEETGDTSLLRNPYVLAALAVAGAIVLAVIVVVLFGGDAGGAGGAEPTPTATVAPLGIGVLGELTAGSAVRQGPGTEFPELGILQAGRKVNVVGRNQSSTWFQILFPPESQGRGWVSATNLRLPDGAASQLEIVAGTPPTAAPATSTPAPTQPPPTATQPAVATAVPRQVDISLSTAGSCNAGAEMAVNIRNIGSDPESRLVRIVTSTPSGTLADSTISLQQLGPGQSVVYNTGQQVQAPRTTVTASFVDDPQDRNPANNVATCIVQGGPTVVPPTIVLPTPTRTP